MYLPVVADSHEELKGQSLHYSIETSLIFELFPFCDNFNEPRQVAVTCKTRSEFTV